MSQVNATQWLRFVLHLSGVILVYFTVAFLFQSILWDDTQKVHNFSNHWHSFLAGFAFIFSFLILLLIEKPVSFWKNILTIPSFGIQKRLTTSLQALSSQNLELIDHKTPSLWIVIWIEIPIGLSLLLYELQNLAYVFFPVSVFKQLWQKFQIPSERLLLDGVNLISLLPFILVLPVLEELFFRGWALGLYKQYFRNSSKPKLNLVLAVFIISLLFAASFLNPWQALLMLPLGILLSWIRIISQSIWAVIIVRVQVSVIGYFFVNLDLPFSLGPINPTLPIEHLSPFLLILGLATLANALWYLYKRSNSLSHRQKMSRGVQA